MKVKKPETWTAWLTCLLWPAPKPVPPEPRRGRVPRLDLGGGWGLEELPIPVIGARPGEPAVIVQSHLVSPSGICWLVGERCRTHRERLRAEGAN